MEKTMPKYTPGPWKMRPNGELWSHSRGSGPRLIGTMAWDGLPADRDGNARILANAVELAENLDEIMLIVSQPEVIQAILGSPRIATRSRMILENARTVLEATTGRQLPQWPRSDPTDKRLEQ